jgi:hypothetical protein
MALGLTQPLIEISNEYQEYFLGVKLVGAYGRHPYNRHVPIVLKSGSLGLLEASGPVQACNGIAVTVMRLHVNWQCCKAERKSTSDTDPYSHSPNVPSWLHSV